MRLRLKPEVKISDLTEYGFKNGIYTRENPDHPYYPLYELVVTRNHRYLQLSTNSATIAGSLQCLIYQLTKDGLVEMVED